VVRIDEMAHLLQRIYTIDPDVILIDLENPSRDVLEQMFQVSRAVKRPVACSSTRAIAPPSKLRSMPASRLHRRGPAQGACAEHLDLCIRAFKRVSRLEGELEAHPFGA